MTNVLYIGSNILLLIGQQIVYGDFYGRDGRQVNQYSARLPR